MSYCVANRGTLLDAEMIKRRWSKPTGSMQTIIPSIVSLHVSESKEKIIRKEDSIFLVFLSNLRPASASVNRNLKFQHQIQKPHKC